MSKRTKQSVVANNIQDIIDFLEINKETISSESVNYITRCLLLAYLNGQQDVYLEQLRRKAK